MLSTNEFNKRQFEAMLGKEVPSQLPVTVTRKSYERILLHASTEHGVWACGKNGARVRLTFVYMYVFEQSTGKMLEYAPVGTFHCSGCDPEPNVHRGDSIFAHEIQTVTA